MEQPLTEEIFAELSKYVERHLSSAPGCHDFDHTMRVLHNSLLLSRLEQCGDTDVIRLAALLHDIARPEEMHSEGRICHAEAGAEAVGDILRRFGITSEELIGSVTEAVRRHRYRGCFAPRTIEEKIIYDADKLDSLGCIGIGRAFHFAGRIGARLHNTEEEAVNSPAYSHEDSAYREYLVKLRHVPGKMLTRSGREMAVERAARMEAFFSSLNQEIYGGGVE